MNDPLSAGPPTAALARDLAPRVRRAVRAQRPMVGLVAWLPLVTLIVRVVLEILALLHRRGDPRALAVMQAPPATFLPESHRVVAEAPGGSR